MKDLQLNACIFNLCAYLERYVAELNPGEVIVYEFDTLSTFFSTFNDVINMKSRKRIADIVMLDANALTEIGALCHTFDFGGVIYGYKIVDMTKLVQYVEHVVRSSAHGE